MKINKELSNPKNNTKKILKKCLSTGKFVSRQSLSDKFNKDNQKKFNYITIYKPRLTPIKGVKENDKKYLIKDANSFKNTYYNNGQKSLFEKIRKTYIEPYNFAKNYKIFKDRTDKFFGEKEMLEDIEKKLKEKNIQVTSLNKDNYNLFNGNLLLSKNKNITKFINNHISSEKSDIKSLTYLNKLDKILSTKLIGKLGVNKKELNKEIYNNLKWVRMLYNEKNSEYMDNVILKGMGISKSQSNIKSDIDSSIANDIKDINIDLENQSNSIDNNIKIIKNNDNGDIKGKALHSKLFHKGLLPLPKSIENKRNNSIKSTILVNDDEEKKMNYNHTKLKIKSNNKMNKNRIIKYNNSISKKLGNKTSKLENKKYSDKSLPNFNQNNYIIRNNKNIKLSKKKSIGSNKSQDIPNITLSTLHQNNSYDKIFKPIVYNKDKNITNLKDIKIFNNNEKYSTEKLYNTIKNLDDSLKCTQLIQEYKNKNIDININYSIKDVLFNYKDFRCKIFNNDVIKKNIDLKKQNLIGLDSLNKLKDFYHRTNLKINDMNDGVNQIFTHF